LHALFDEAVKFVVSQSAQLEGVHSAVGSLLAAADAAAHVWTVPRAPGKWSSSQVAEHVPATPAQARARLENARKEFDQACRSRAESGQRVSSTMFGPVSVSDFEKFQELHVRHHAPQMSGPT